MIEIEELVIRYGTVTAVDRLRLTIAEGSRFGLLGPNGAGKSSTMSAIAGLVTPTSGTIRVRGVDAVRHPTELRRLIGLVPQSLALYSNLTVQDNLRVFGGLMGLAGKRLRDRVAWALELAQLEPKRRAKVDELSGGMKRRLNLAASLLHEPKIILCDEPTAGVDPQSRNHIFETIRSLQKSGVTVVYTTHYMEEVEALCDEVAIIDHGQIIAHDELDRLLAMPTASKGYSIELREPMALDAVERAFRCADFAVAAVRPTPRTLEEVFLELTGRQLREAD